MDIDVYFEYPPGSGRTIRADGALLLADTTAIQPIIRWPADASRFYTVAIYDIDFRGYMHFLVVNVPGSDIASGKVLLPYLGPQPPPTDPAHTYIVDVYLQSRELRLRTRRKREDFDLGTFVVDNGMDQAYRTSFRARAGEERLSTLPSGDAPDKFIPDSTLDERQRSYCRCVLAVAARQPAACNTDRAWFDEREGKTCYNPYAVCAKSVGTTARTCGDNYNYEALTDEELAAYIGLLGAGVPSRPYNRAELLRLIAAYKGQT